MILKIKENYPKEYLAGKFSEMSKKSAKSANSLRIPKMLQHTASLLGIVSPKMQTRFASRLFSTPIRHKRPQRELPMLAVSKRRLQTIPSLSKDIVVYEYGSSVKKVLLVHGWSGRGTQLVRIADSLLAAGYATISFDAPAHGNSNGSTTLMTEFIECILELEKTFGPFEAAVGHSLGGMSLLNAVASGLKINRLAIVGSGDKISDILSDFVGKLGQKPMLAGRMREHFESRFSGRTMESFSSYLAASKVTIPVLVIHDLHDVEVPVSAAHHIHEHLPQSQLIVTENLGHRKILGNTEVVNAIRNFIETDSK